MENRGTGLTPRRPPPEWQKSKVNMTSEPDQGPSKTMAPTSRDHSPGAASFMDVVMRGRPSSVLGEQRGAQAPIPSQVIDVLADSPGGFIAQTVAGGSFAAEEQHDGGGGNTSETIGKGVL